MIGTMDATLAGLVSAVGLELPPSVEAWEERLRDRLDDEVYAEYLEHRMGYSAGFGPDPLSAFYDFAGSRVELALLMLEGRLGYHAAVLPAVAEAVAGGPHASILDLGCSCGLTTLYLARRFPDSQVVGIDRCAGLVGVARALKDRARAPNVDFHCGDYVGHNFGRPFDVAVSLHAMPAYFLPFIESERPESYQRGETLTALAADPVLPHRRVRWCLEAVRRLVGENGRAVLQERLTDVSRVLLFALLAAEAGLGTASTQVVSWEAANEVNPGRQTGPLIVAEARTPPAEFSEDRVIGLLYPPAKALPKAPAPGSGQAAVITGPLAQQAYQALPTGRRSLCVKAAARDGRRWHLHLGLVEGAASYAYSCDTHGSRELRLADVRQARQVFAAAAQGIAQSARSGTIVALEPKPEQLAAAIDALLRG